MLEKKIYNDLYTDLERFLSICECEMFIKYDNYNKFANMIEKLNNQIEMLEIIKEVDKK